MFRPRVWFNFLIPPLKPWERAAVEAWLEAAAPEMREAGYRQLEQANFVQRLDHGRSVNLYRFPFGLRRQAFRPLFQIAEREKQVAEIRMSINGVETTARLWVVNGHIFELTFDRPPGASRGPAKIEILGLKAGPFPSDRRGNDLAAALPADFAEAAGRPDLGGSGIDVLTLDQVYAATIAGELYWLLAEKPDCGMLGVPVEGDDRRVCFLFLDGRPARRLSVSFAEAVAKAAEME